jgi:hypothetical protein
MFTDYNRRAVDLENVMFATGFASHILFMSLVTHAATYIVGSHPKLKCDLTAAFLIPHFQ